RGGRSGEGSAEDDDVVAQRIGHEGGILSGRRRFRQAPFWIGSVRTAYLPRLPRGDVVDKAIGSRLNEGMGPMNRRRIVIEAPPGGIFAQKMRNLYALTRIGVAALRARSFIK